MIRRGILEQLPASSADRTMFLYGLAGELILRFEESGQQKDLDEGISTYRDALELQLAPKFDRCILLIDLAQALNRRFCNSGQLEDLDEAILMHRAALKLSPAPKFRFTILNGLAGALTTRFERTTQREDLNEAISSGRSALELQPAFHPNRSMPLTNLANALGARFLQSGQRKDLDEAISLQREALRLFSESHPDQSPILNNLASVLSQRFDHSGQRHDIDEAITWSRRAVELLPTSHPDRLPFLTNLANMLNARFDKFETRRDLDEAISLGQDALKLFSAAHPDKPILLDMLGSALMKRSGCREDLDEAILHQRDSLALKPTSHSHRYGSLYNLGHSLRKRFDQYKQREDLDESIDLFKESLDAVSSGHPHAYLISDILGRTYLALFTRTHELDHLNKALGAFRVAVACEAAPASKRMPSAKSWARMADLSGHESALDAYRSAIGLLPRLAMLNLDLQSRQQSLTVGSDGLARDAAACAIRLGQYDTAVELLEAGRAIFWSQSLQLRTPMTDLHDVAPELEQELRRIAVALEQGSTRDMSENLFDNSLQMMSMEQEESRFCHLNEEWLVTLDKVRQLDGFQDFLRPSRLSTLQSAAANGPVVILNASQSGCAALIVTSTGVQHVPFMDLGLSEVTKLVELIRHAIAEGAEGAEGGKNALVHESNRTRVIDLVRQMPLISDRLQMLRPRLGQKSDNLTGPDDIFRYVLCTLWLSVVKPILDLLHLEVNLFISSAPHAALTSMVEI